MARNSFEDAAPASDGDFAEASMTLFSTPPGTEPTLQLERLCEVLRSEVTSSWHAVQVSMWAETNWARSAKSSPSRWDMISSGVNGCGVVLIDGCLSVGMLVPRPATRLVRRTERRRLLRMRPMARADCGGRCGRGRGGSGRC